MTTTNNFFENVIDLTSDDILFFDTNVLVKLLIDSERGHEAVKHFFVHAINSDCELKTSETVIQELLFIIAKTLYTVDRSSNGTPPIVWSSLTKKPILALRDLVKRYNSLAKKEILKVLELLDFEETTLDTTIKALEFSSKYNLQSADAFILSSTYLANAKLITLDKDFLHVTDVDVIYSHAHNTFVPSIYDGVEDHKVMLDFLEEVLRVSP